MKKINGYSEQIHINGETYTVTIIARGKGIKTIYDSFVSYGDITKEMSGFPIDQMQANEPKVYTPDEIMELAIFEAEDFIGDLSRLERFQDMMFEFLDEVDENRKIQKEICEFGNNKN